MRSATRIALLIGLAAVAACSKAPRDQNVAIDINDADPSDIEAVPADETSIAPADDLGNGTGNGTGNVADNVADGDENAIVNTN